MKNPVQPNCTGFQLVDKVLAPQRALFSRSVSGIKKASFARFFDTFNSIGSVVPIERLSKTMFFDSLTPGAAKLHRVFCRFSYFSTPCAMSRKIPGVSSSVW